MLVRWPSSHRRLLAVTGWLARLAGRAERGTSDRRVRRPGHGDPLARGADPPTTLPAAPDRPARALLRCARAGRLLGMACRHRPTWLRGALGERVPECR